MNIEPLPPQVTSVTSVDLYGTSARTGDPLSLPAALVDGVWTVDTLNVPPGRYWPTVRALKVDVPYSYPLDLADLPIDDSLVVSPEAVAKSAGVPLPLTDDQRETIIEVIREAQADVEGYLHRPIVPTEFKDVGLDDFGDAWALKHVADSDDEVTILSVEPDGVGTFTVTYKSGLNARDDMSLRPIRRYVLSHAKNSPEFTRLWIDATNAEGEISSLSADGQSVSFRPATLGGGGKAGSGDPGSLPGLASLDFWRVRSVYQALSRFGRALL